MVEQLGMQAAPNDVNGLVDQLAYWLPFSFEQKLELLAEPDVAARFAQLEVWLEALQQANQG